MSAAPIFANVINTGRVTEHLRNGHGNSVTITPHTSTVLVSYEFVVWEPLPNTIKIVSYVMNDGKVLYSLPPMDDSLNDFIRPVTAITAAG